MSDDPHTYARDVLQAAGWKGDVQDPRDLGRPNLVTNHLPDDFVWLGDLAGWEVVPTLRDTPTTDGWPPMFLELRHRCGYSQRQPWEGITGDGGAYVANIVERVIQTAGTHRCFEREPSPEHRERVARWTAAAGLTPTGDVATDQLELVRALSRCPALLVDGKWQSLSDFRANEGADGRQPFRVKPDTVTVECLGDSCTGCSNPQCWTARADGGDV